MTSPGSTAAMHAAGSSNIAYARRALLGQSSAMRALMRQIERCADSQASVLVQGETGTGKDLVAQLIHGRSARAQAPFVVIDCSALSPTLAESELFGHERGAFTGAQNARAGLFEEAHGGTVFLDELAELPRELQPKLLRVLEQRTIRRVGSTRHTEIDVRVICATHRNLAEEVANGRFREDLYYRVAAITMNVPALRERLEDLPLLVEHFIRHDALVLHASQIPELAWRQLESHAWPGNVRELRNVVQRLSLTPGQPFEEPPAISQVHSSLAESGVRACAALELRAARKQCMTEFEREYITQLLERAAHNVSGAARLAGVSRQMIQRLMVKHRISRGS